MSDIRERMEFPTNSHRSRSPKDIQEDPKIPERKIKKVTKGIVKRQKKSLGKKFKEMIFGEESMYVKDYVIFDVVIPAFKSLIWDTLTGSLEMRLFGQVRGSSRRPVNNRRDYTKPSYINSRDHDRDRDRRDISRKGRSNHEFDEIILQSRAEAEAALDQLIDFIIDYGQATVADLYESVNANSHFTDHKYGWTDLRDAYVSRVKEGYLINLPKAKLLD